MPNQKEVSLETTWAQVNRSDIPKQFRNENHQGPMQRALLPLKIWKTHGMLTFDRVLRFKQRASNEISTFDTVTGTNIFYHFLSGGESHKKKKKVLYNKSSIYQKIDSREKRNLFCEVISWDTHTHTKYEGNRKILPGFDIRNCHCLLSVTNSLPSLKNTLIRR